MSSVPSYFPPQQPPQPYLGSQPAMANYLPPHHPSQPDSAPQPTGPLTLPPRLSFSAHAKPRPVPSPINIDLIKLYPGHNNFIGVLQSCRGTYYAINPAPGSPFHNLPSCLFPEVMQRWPHIFRPPPRRWHGPPLRPPPAPMPQPASLLPPYDPAAVLAMEPSILAAPAPGAEQSATRLPLRRANGQPFPWQSALEASSTEMSLPPPALATTSASSQPMPPAGTSTPGLRNPHVNSQAGDAPRGNPNPSFLQMTNDITGLQTTDTAQAPARAQDPTRPAANVNPPAVGPSTRARYHRIPLTYNSKVNAGNPGTIMSTPMWEMNGVLSRIDGAGAELAPSPSGIDERQLVQPTPLRTYGVSLAAMLDMPGFHEGVGSHDAGDGDMLPAAVLPHGSPTPNPHTPQHSTPPAPTEAYPPSPPYPCPSPTKRGRAASDDAGAVPAKRHRLAALAPKLRPLTPESLAEIEYATDSPPHHAGRIGKWAATVASGKHVPAPPPSFVDFAGDDWRSATSSDLLLDTDDESDADDAAIVVHPEESASQVGRGEYGAVSDGASGRGVVVSPELWRERYFPPDSAYVPPLPGQLRTPTTARLARAPAWVRAAWEFNDFVEAEAVALGLSLQRAEERWAAYVAERGENGEKGMEVRELEDVVYARGRYAQAVQMADSVLDFVARLTAGLV